VKPVPSNRIEPQVV